MKSYTWFVFSFFLLTYFNAAAQLKLKLTESDAKISQQFKQSLGNSRIALFNQLNHLLIKVPVEITSATPSIHPSNKSDIISLFGPPNFQLNETEFGYYLSLRNSPCAITFYLNQAALLIDYKINECEKE